MPIHTDHHRLLYKISQAYYVEELTQQQIAKRFSLSRPKVSRLLQQARDERIVNITLVPPSGGTTDLESALEKKFDLDEVMVVSVSDARSRGAVARELGPAAAEALVRSVQGQEIIAIAWGASISGMVDALPSASWPQVRVVQLIGGLGPVSSHEHSAELVRRAAQKLNAKFHLIPAPGIVASTAAAKALKEDREIAETLSMAAQANVALVGMGVLSPESVLLQSGTILSQHDIALLEGAGAAGDVVLRFLDEDGAPLDLEINKRIVGLTLEQIKKIPRVIGVAGGKEKYQIILAALRSRILNVLITDHVTAQRLKDEKDL